MNNIVTAVGFFLMLVFFITLIPNHLIVYEKTTYPIDIIKSELELSLETHGIEERVKYLDRTHSALAPYHGNSEWWFPEENTNIDLTKELIADISRDVHNQLGVKERENYFFIPHNELITYLDSETKNIKYRLGDYAHSDYWHPDNNPYWYIGAPMILVGLVTFITGLAMRGEDD